ncbi:hypothetical protein [Paractinoplanes durhamensis]|uniref:Uncharacterized protein n=1 Tax=Paractinoplanes durhamensis TaxID=113563 RepID=A0ABQ3YZF5_9ACTN|nr:hypothetical protein [Actinoplanes durhamensis]GIE02973.1 hypothetical protein Adu01nite_43230 [Actinoplanes durhamensis]
MIRKTGVALAIAAGVLGVAALSTPALAAAEDGQPNLGEFVLFDAQNYAGNRYDTNVDVVAYTGKVFKSAAGVAAGAVNDKARSIANYHQTKYVHTYINFGGAAGGGGAYITVLPYQQTSGSLSWAYYDLESFDLALSGHEFI